MTQTDHTHHSKLKRALKARHLSMIAIGGSIGTGLFVASGKTIAQAGPGGAMLSYLVVGMMVYFVMTSLAELAAYMPTTGSFATYSAEYVDEGFGFAMGLNYWYNWAVTIAVDLVSLQLVMAYWLPYIDGWKWSALFLLLMFWMNYISVKGFGEAEFWFSLIKVVTVIVFIIIGVLMMIGIMQGSEVAGWKNWTIGDAPFVGGFSAMIGVAMVIGFSFQGTELVGIAAGESEDPEKNIPKATRQIFWRILLFYVLAIFVISYFIPYTDPRLLSNSEQDIALSPFTLVFEHAGLLSAAAIMNAVILTAVLSAGNSGMYASSRMLYALACDGKAPKCFTKLSSTGVPVNALYASTMIAMLCFLTSTFDNKQVYNWLLSLSGMTGFIAWLGIAISHYRFRKGYMKQGRDLSKLPYQAGLFPFGPVFAFIVCSIIILGQEYQAFVAGTIDWYKMTSTYISIPLFFVIWFSYKCYKKTRIVAYEQMQFHHYD